MIDQERLSDRIIFLREEEGYSLYEAKKIATEEQVVDAIWNISDMEDIRRVLDEIFHYLKNRG